MSPEVKDDKHRGQSTTSAPACPFAEALQEETPQNKNHSSPKHLPGLIELQACPAFSNKECPFKGLAADQVAEKLASIPPSHMEKNGTFYKTLEFLHRQTTTNHHSAAELGCPVKHALPADWSFDDAMEEHALAAIIGHLAQEWETTTQDDEATASSSEEEEEEDSTIMLTTLPPALTSSLSLSEALKNGTAMAHEAAESVHFVKNFIRGNIDRDLYALLVAQLFHLYSKLEEALDLHAAANFGNCHFPAELHRSQSLQEDVEFWHTTSTPPVSPATQDYLDRIEHLSKTNPLLLLAHAYTRYLGDLSGGKVLARVARRALNLTTDDAGLAFYHFEHVQSFKLFKDKYRSSLNALGLTNEQISQLVQEANVAFLLNMRLFEELDVIDNVPHASVRPLKEVYQSASRVNLATVTSAAEDDDDDEISKCPFIFKNPPTTVTKTNDDGIRSGGGVCPWPFILMHDPKAGMKQWQTWLVIGLMLVYGYQLMAYY